MSVLKLEITLDDSTVVISGSIQEVKKKLKTDIEWNKEITSIHSVTTFTANGYAKWFGLMAEQASKTDDTYKFEKPVKASIAIEGVFQTNNMEFLLQ